MRTFKEIRKSLGLTKKQASKQARISLAKLDTLEFGSEEGIYLDDYMRLLKVYGVDWNDVYEHHLNMALYQAEREAREKVLIEWGRIKAPQESVQA